MTHHDKQQRLSDYLSHILQAIERIGRYTHATTEAEFLVNEMIHDALAGMHARVREHLLPGEWKA